MTWLSLCSLMCTLFVNHPQMELWYSAIWPCLVNLVRRLLFLWKTDIVKILLLTTKPFSLQTLEDVWCMLHLHLCIYQTIYPKRLTVHSGYTFVLSVCVIRGNRTHNLCAANAMLYHWATGTLVHFLEKKLIHVLIEFTFSAHSTCKDRVCIGHLLRTALKRLLMWAAHVKCLQHFKCIRLHLYNYKAVFAIQ